MTLFVRRPIARATALLLLLAPALGAQTLTGYTPARAAAQRSAEQAAIRRPDTARVGERARATSSSTR